MGDKTASRHISWLISLMLVSLLGQATYVPPRAMTYRWNVANGGLEVWLSPNSSCVSIRPLALGRLDGEKQPLASEGTFSSDAEGYLIDRGLLRERICETPVGVRQDFIISERPVGGGPLLLLGEVRGARMRVSKGIIRLDLGGGQGVAYTHLRVYDASLRRLPAHFTPAGPQQFAVLVDDTDALYPIVIDPTITDANWESIWSQLGGDGAIKAIVVDEVSGKVYIGGSFHQFGNVTSSSLLVCWDGTNWSDVGGGLEGDEVSALAIDIAGNLYVGGHFLQAGETPVGNIAMWDGATWDDLQGGSRDGEVQALAVDPITNELYVGGSFSELGGTYGYYSLARWDGVTWHALGDGTDGAVAALAVDPLGRVYMGGDFNYVGGSVWSPYFARWNGSDWDQLNAEPDGAVYALAVNQSGDVFLGGQFATVNGTAVNRVCKFSGGTVSTLGSGLSGSGLPCAYSLVFDAAGNLIVGGNFTEAGGLAARNVAKWNGSAWSSLGPGLRGEPAIGSPMGSPPERVFALAYSNDVGLLAGGLFSASGTNLTGNFVMWNGSAWLPPPGQDEGIAPLPYFRDVRAIEVDSMGRVFVGGGFWARLDGKVFRNVACWDGSNWLSLGDPPDQYITCLESDFSGNLYAGGYFVSIGGIPAMSIAKWDGTSWQSLGGANLPVLALLWDNDNSCLYAGGFFTSIGSQPAARVAKYVPGSGWTALGSGISGGSSPFVQALALDSAGRLFVGGAFQTAGGEAANNIACWTGTTWQSLGTGTNGQVYDVLWSPHGELYACGEFTVAGGVTVNRIARWNGSTWESLGSGANSRVRTMAWQGGTLYVGGEFSTISGLSVNYIAQFGNGVWGQMGSGCDYWVMALAADPSSETLFVGGAFDKAGGVARKSFAKVSGVVVPIFISSIQFE